ncbi:MAG TPA: type III pantothenate kinase [Woeseiaceae bacterium]|nr:type III pantothenate kinase [Woeseiaceae bacterium]
MKVLLLDVGNTRLKWGIGENGEIHRTGHLAQKEIREKGISVLTTRLPRHMDAVIASNVAGQSYATRLAGVIGAHLGLDIHFARSTRTACGVTNGYTQPRRLGVDRWMGLIGAWAELGRACLVVDAGTAVTLDALDDKGQHLGGQIIAGTELMARALAQDTSDIPLARTAGSKQLVGMEMFARNTRGAVQGGALNALAGAVSNAIKVLRSNAYEAELVLTGGDASRILAALDETPLHRPNLVLQGLLRTLEAERPTQS